MNIVIQDAQGKRREVFCGSSFGADPQNPQHREYCACIAAKTQEATDILQQAAGGSLPASPRFDDFKAAVEGLTDGKNTVILDDLGLPSVMVALPKQNSQDLCAELEERTHPAWICDGEELDVVYMSKFQNILMQGRAYSLPIQDPAAGLTMDDALAACRQKGADWGLSPAALWGAIALWAKKNGTLPRGNNHYGADHYAPEEKGVPMGASRKNPERAYHTATGSGPVAWNHNGQGDGIADLNGNVAEWQAGLRLLCGEIGIVENADCMRSDLSLAADSDAWRAVDAMGALIPPESPESIKMDCVSDTWQLSAGPNFQSRADTSRFCYFKSMTSTLPEVPQLLKELALYPADSDRSGYKSEYLYASNGSPEAVLLRGGSYANRSIAGLFCAGLNLPRSYTGPYFGFRSAFYGKP